MERLKSNYQEKMDHYKKNFQELREKLELIRNEKNEDKNLKEIIIYET